MAKHKQQPTIDQPNLKKAVDLFGFCARHIYALDDIGRRFAGNPFTPTTMSWIITAITEAIRTKLREAEEAISVEGMPPHKAHIESAGATDILAAMDDFIINITADDEYLLQEKNVGTVIYDFTVHLAQAIERAQLACGARSTDTDYLSNSDHDPCRVQPRQSESAGLY